MLERDKKNTQIYWEEVEFPMNLIVEFLAKNTSSLRGDIVSQNAYKNYV